MPKSKWFRFEVGDIYDVDVRDVECSQCGCDFDADDVVVSREGPGGDEPVFCCTGCGVVYERELEKCRALLDSLAHAGQPVRG